MTFSDLGLSPETLRAIDELGYATPTPIQEQAIPWVLMGRDVLGIAQTGTGKTASFTLPMIDILASGRAKARMPRSLILAPTRELANQVSENFQKYGKYHKLAMALLIGGESFSEQEKALDKGVDVLIATPGRLLDLFERGRILLRDVKVLVIDEADRMLDMGFIPDVERIVSLLPPLRQTLFFSATMDATIGKLADAFLQNPKEVRVAPLVSAAETVTQHLVVVDDMDKREALRRIIRKEDVRNAFIFCNRKRDVDTLYRSLTKHSFDAVQLHGDMAQSERTATLARFKAGQVRLMVCSDVAARGIDIADVSHVFNFDPPMHPEDYIHRIGRTGRAGREGRAYTIATPEDTKNVFAIEKLIGREIPRIEVEGLQTAELSEEAAKAAKRGRGKPGRGARPEKQRDRQPHPAQAEAAAQPTQEAAPPREEPAQIQREPAQQRQEPSNRKETSDAGQDRRPDGHRPDGRRSDSQRGGRDDRRSRRGHPSWDAGEMAHGEHVTGFGDHVPAFVTAPLTATEAKAAASAGKAEARRKAAEKQPQVEAEGAEQTEEKPKRSRRRRRSGEAKPTAVETSEIQGADVVAEAEPKRRVVRRKKAEPEAGQDAAETEVMSAAEAGAPADSEAAVQVEAPAEPGAPVEAAEVPKKAKRATTRKPAARKTPAKKAKADVEAVPDNASVAANTTKKAAVKKAPAKRAAAKKKAETTATADQEKKPAPRKRTPRATKKSEVADATANGSPAES